MSKNNTKLDMLCMIFQTKNYFCPLVLTFRFIRPVKNIYSKVIFQHLPTHNYLSTIINTILLAITIVLITFSSTFLSHHWFRYSTNSL